MEETLQEMRDLLTVIMEQQAHLIGEMEDMKAKQGNYSYLEGEISQIKNTVNHISGVVG